MIWIYVIIFIVILVLYGASMTYRYLDIHAKYHKQKIHRSLHDVVNEVILMIHHKEDNMDKGNYKNNKESEYLEGKSPEPLTEKDFSVDHHVDPVYCDASPKLFFDGLSSTLAVSGSLAVQPKAPSLTSLLDAKPTDADYENILEKLIELFQVTYNEYKFYLAKSSDETKAPNFLQVESPSTEYSFLHKQIFRLAVDTNMDMHELQVRFAKKAAEGKVVDLGDNVVIITKDNTPQLPTGVSPIQNGLEGSAITFIISFMRAENFEAWKKNTFPEDAKDGE